MTQTVKMTEFGKVHKIRFPWMTLCGRDIDGSHIVSNTKADCGVCQKLSSQKRIDKVIGDYGVTVSLGWDNGRCVDVSIVDKQKNNVMSISFVNGFDDCVSFADAIAKGINDKTQTYSVSLVSDGNIVGSFSLSNLPESGTLFVLVNQEKHNISVFRSGVYQIMDLAKLNLAVDVSPVKQVIAFSVTEVTA